MKKLFVVLVMILSINFAMANNVEPMTKNASIEKVVKESKGEVVLKNLMMNKDMCQEFVYSGPFWDRTITSYSVYHNPYNDSYHYMIVSSDGSVTTTLLGYGEAGEISAWGTCGMIS